MTSPSGQQETFKILINLEHLRQTLERKSLTAVQKSQCEIITPKKPGEAILHAFNATYQQIRENMSEFARCHYGYIQIPPVTTFRADGPETPEEEKGYWFHAYQPEDLCTIHNPMGDLQDFIALVKDAKKFGIDIIPDYTFNFMGIGGSGKNDLDYPSADIRAKISKDIESGIPGYWQGQVLIPFTIDPVTKERKQIHPEDIHLTAKDFEASKDNISKDEWENLHALKEKRLNGMPKTTPKSDQVIMLQNQYVREMRKYGVRGLRYDAAKHSKHEQIERSITPPLKNYNERLHNTNLFNPKYHEKVVMNYMEYLVTCQLDEEQMSSLLYERDGKENQINFILKGDEIKDVKGVQDSLIEGLNLKNLDTNLKTRLGVPSEINGVLIDSVKPKSKAKDAGFKEGDIIIAVGQSEVKDLKDLQNTLKNQVKNAWIKIWVYRGGVITLLVLK